VTLRVAHAVGSAVRVLLITPTVEVPFVLAVAK
jgi:hypothetical protein